MLVMFELQGDSGDEDRVKMNLIIAAAQQGTLERTEEGDEIRFQGIVIVKDEELEDGKD